MREIGPCDEGLGPEGPGFKSRRPDCSKNQLCNDFRCGAFSWVVVSLWLEGAVGISWGNGRVYNSGDADLSYEILCIHNTITLAPRVGLSTMILNDRTAQNGINAGIVVRRRTSDNGFLRVECHLSPSCRAGVGHPGGRCRVLAEEGDCAMTRDVIGRCHLRSA